MCPITLGSVVKFGPALGDQHPIVISESSHWHKSGILALSTSVIGHSYLILHGGDTKGFTFGIKVFSAVLFLVELNLVFFKKNSLQKEVTIAGGVSTASPINLWNPCRAPCTSVLTVSCHIILLAVSNSALTSDVLQFTIVHADIAILIVVRKTSRSAGVTSKVFVLHGPVKVAVNTKLRLYLKRCTTFTLINRVTFLTLNT